MSDKYMIHDASVYSGAYILLKNDKEYGVFAEKEKADEICKELSENESRKNNPITVEVMDYLIREAEKYFIDENTNFLSIENFKAMRNRINEECDDGK